MKLHELRAPEGARKESRRVGRGTGSGRGKTSGRGQKGQRARGQGFRLGFEGGQMPLAQRLPKLGGFKNRFKQVYAAVNLTKLNHFQDGAAVDPDQMYEAGLARRGVPIKLLGTGKLRRKLTITAHAASESARTAVEARGGTVTVIESATTRPSPTEGGGDVGARRASPADEEEPAEA